MNTNLRQAREDLSSFHRGGLSRRTLKDGGHTDGPMRGRAALPGTRAQSALPQSRLSVPQPVGGGGAGMRDRDKIRRVRRRGKGRCGLRVSPKGAPIGDKAARGGRERGGARGKACSGSAALRGK